MCGSCGPGHNHVSRGPPIYISRLSLLNIRNYERLVLDLEPGMVLFRGENGQGKTNLLEAIYILAIARSSRATADREMVRWQSLGEATQAQVSAIVRRDAGMVRVQIDYRGNSGASPPVGAGLVAASPGTERQPGEQPKVQKYVRVNGVPRRTSDLVGEVNAVMFSARDLELVPGAPSVRRRYLDILISQIDRRYLKALQHYHRVVVQRNHLLKALRVGRSRSEELDFWDESLVESGAYIVACRAGAVRRLSDAAAPIHRELTGHGEGLALNYRPSVDIDPGQSEDDLARSLRRALHERRAREVEQGFTLTGPHRDDIQMVLNGMDAGLYASRGQCRTIVLAMKLAEAAYLSERRGQEPILLLDDVLSELDAGRRSHVLNTASRYEQCFITATDLGSIENEYLSRMSRFLVRAGRVEPASG